MIPDDYVRTKTTVSGCRDQADIDIVVTTGGTRVTDDDVTSSGAVSGLGVTARRVHGEHPELPPEDERPSVVALWRGVDPTSGSFFPSPLHQYHNQTKPLYRLGLEDGYDAEIPSGGSVGYEELLDHDPDYIAVVGSLTSDTHEGFVNQIVEPFENDANGQELTAVQEGNIIRSGGQYMGPTVDLFATEAVAKQVWPDRFGEWPGPVRDVSEDEQLFDRQEVSDIINGNF
ncbi:putative ABC-type transport system substrate-binding protein (substrate iron/cobalamin) [Natrialba aegyptia DSM 13077]|uniref:Putative ABC-type transport system substrate-binding protein (Substrate iron/cobalamin) n=1 Tax=Natrialba aegyptia DSM 13077 TaxID=1227491 RepID=M0AXQ9_9EURY|nr:iron ABC transporter substrate-binding protein [Natrialba aegyptia]ELZ02204.1 putative ABC-type transport system substrate-binding protein (substrate iron/cobalamin) [Natrialba aegyptia DSM 13077]